MDPVIEPKSSNGCKTFWSNFFAACLGCCALMCVCCGKVEDEIERN